MNRIGIAAGGIAFGLVAGAGVSAAVDPGAPEVLHACAANNDGALRLVAAEEPCKKSETPVMWNAQGLPGEPGPTGPESSTVYWANTTSSTEIVEMGRELTYSNKHLLPAGTYSVDGRIFLTRIDNPDVQFFCFLSATEPGTDQLVPQGVVNGIGEVGPLTTYPTSWAIRAYPNAGTVPVAELSLSSVFELSREAEVGYGCEPNGAELPSGTVAGAALPWSWLRFHSVGNAIDLAPPA